MKATRARFTVAKSASLVGIGLQSGKRCRLDLRPAVAGDDEVSSAQPNLISRGVVFRRLDLSHCPEIAATVHSRHPKSFRTTNLAVNGDEVGTVEHLLAALHIAGIDDVLIDLDGPEVPILDGSARPFVELIKGCGKAPSSGAKAIWSPDLPIAHLKGPTKMVALPSSKSGVSCFIDYKQSPLIGCQYYTGKLHEEISTCELAPARTFCLLHEAEQMRAQGAMLGGNLSNAVVLDGERVLSDEGLRFQDEMVRHKALDLIGDLALLDFDLQAHILAICPSHEENAAFARAIEHQFKTSL